MEKTPVFSQMNPIQSVRGTKHMVGYHKTCLSENRLRRNVTQMTTGHNIVTGRTSVAHPSNIADASNGPDRCSSKKKTAAK